MEDLSKVYLIEEYKALRKEIVVFQKLDHTTQRNAILASGAVLTFVFSRQPEPFLSFVLLIVPLILLIAYFQQSRYKANCGRVGRYLNILESAVYCNSSVSNENNITGWEHFLEEERKAETIKSKEIGDKGYWNEFSKALRGDGRSLSATVVDARYLAIGVVLFTFVAILYFFYTAK